MTAANFSRLNGRNPRLSFHFRSVSATVRRLRPRYQLQPYPLPSTKHMPTCSFLTYLFLCPFVDWRPSPDLPVLFHNARCPSLGDPGTQTVLEWELDDVLVQEQPGEEILSMERQRRERLRYDRSMNEEKRPSRSSPVDSFSLQNGFLKFSSAFREIL